jgi:hypothetical protein
MTQPLNYDKALKSDVNLNAVNSLQTDKKIDVDQLSSENEKTFKPSLQTQLHV